MLERLYVRFIRWLIGDIPVFTNMEVGCLPVRDPQTDEVLGAVVYLVRKGETLDTGQPIATIQYRFASSPGTPAAGTRLN